MNKLVIIINGKGRSGKDTICEIVARRFAVEKISSITPLLAIARAGGWQGEKNDRSRRLLSELKRAFTEYNDLSFMYLNDEYQKFLRDDNLQVLFLHIREPEEIRRAVSMVSTIPCLTLLVRRHDADYQDHCFGNASDDGVENYSYDYTYDGNNSTVDELETDFNRFFDRILKERNIRLDQK